MFDTMNPHDWLSLPIETRLKLKEAFSIKRSGGTHVAGGVVQTDGYTPKDLSVLNITTLKEYTGLESDNFVELFKATLIKLENRYETEADQTGSGEVSQGTATQTEGQNEGESKEPAVSTPPQAEPDRVGNTDGHTSPLNRPTSSVHESNGKDDGSRPRTQKRPK